MKILIVDSYPLFRWGIKRLLVETFDTAVVSGTPLVTPGRRVTQELAGSTVRGRMAIRGHNDCIGSSDRPRMHAPVDGTRPSRRSRNRGPACSARRRHYLLRHGRRLLLG